MGAFAFRERAVRVSAIRMLHFEETNLKGLYIIDPEVREDNRGHFMELFRKDNFAEIGADIEFVQQNVSVSKKGVIRGLHFQWDKPLGKLIRVPRGKIFGVAVDIRKKSPTLGHWFGAEMSEENKKEMWAPPGFATGFCALTDASVEYLYTALYNPNGESNIVWNDQEIKIEWPTRDPILSERDAGAEKLADWLGRPESDNF